MNAKTTARRVRFGDCLLDEGRGLLIAPGGETVLRPKTFELLRLMLDNAGRVVARNDILDAVWPGLFVTDDSITQCVVEIRKAIGARGAEVLKTLPRRGYILEAEVTVEASPALVAAPLLSPRGDDRPSIAVLPFRKDHPDPQDAYFADGVIEGIVHVLSGLHELFVVSRSSVLALAEATTDPREIGARLGVRYTLYGGVRRAGNRLRITTELSDTETGAVIRTDRYDGESTDLFALQDRIAEQVVTTIAPQVRERELARVLRKPPQSLTGYDLVLRALDQIQRLERASFAEAQGTLRQAIAADPYHALAHSYLAWWHILRIVQGWSEDRSGDAAEAGASALAAIQRDPRDGLALAIRAYVIGFTQRDYAGAAELLDRATSASPNCALAWTFRSMALAWSGDAEGAVERAARALRLAPFDPFTYLHQHCLAQAHYTGGDFAQAIVWAQRSALLNPRHAPNWRTMIASLAAAGRLKDCAEPVARLLEVEPGFSLRAFSVRTPLPPGQRETFISRLSLAGLPD